jgi:hypothetical protein
MRVLRATTAPVAATPATLARPISFQRPFMQCRSLRAVDESVLSLDEAVATAATGDIWLFRGKSIADRAIQTVTNSPINHVGMAVALDDMPALMWHAELGRSLPDVFTGEHQRGVQLHILRDAVTVWDTKYGQRAWMRQLQGTVRKEHEDKLMEMIDSMDGKGFPTTVGLAGSWITGRVRRRDVSKETIYCAELVAATYQHMGLLPKRRPPSWYDPGKFWSGDQIEMADGFSLGEEIAIR